MFWFGVPWTTFGLAWTAIAAGFKVPSFREASDYYCLIGVTFVLSGIGFLSMPFGMVWKARRTVYVLSTERAIILDSGALIFDGGSSITIHSIEASELLNLRRTECDDGSGDLIIREHLYFDDES